MTKTATSRKATHSGHCQLCGHLQKLPQGVLAKHGYTTRYGYFSGTCHGSGHLPFEQSFDLILLAIERAKGELSRVEAFQATLRTPATEPKAWVHNYEYEAVGGRGRRGYHWRKVTIDSEEKSYTGRTFTDATERTHTWTEYFYVAPGSDKPGDVRHRLDGVSGMSALDIATAKNATYADWLEHEADSLRRYIAWQERRVREWKEAPLVPVDAKDKEGFVPTQPKY